MLRTLIAGVTALLVMASPPLYAQTASGGEHSGTAGIDSLTDMRIAIVKEALQLTPDQEKYWSPIEDAIRDRAKHRQARIADAAKRMADRRNSDPIEVLRNRDPIAFMRRRADALQQRGADLKKLADAWEPLYQTLKPDQKKRMAFLALFVIREMSDRREQRRARFEGDERE